MRAVFLSLLVGFLLAGCGGPDNDQGGGLFQLIEFLESGQNSVARNRVLIFRFSIPIQVLQDFAERLKILNVRSGASSNFARAIGDYLVDGDRVSFVPRLPNKPDRSDAGFKSNGNYHVF